MLKNRFVQVACNLPILVLVFLPFLFKQISVSTASGTENALPSFSDFVKPIEADYVNDLFGVYVPNVLALAVVQQPAGDASFVSRHDDQATQFAMASQYGNIGLLAHNYLSGKFFSNLVVGQEVRLVYGDRKVEYFVVTEILRYQALEPNSQWSSFRNLDHEEVLSAEQMFSRAYAGDRHVTFQTCIAANGNSSWGRLFVIAVPKSFSFDQLIQQFLQ